MVRRQFSEILYVCVFGFKGVILRKCYCRVDVCYAFGVKPQAQHKYI